MVSLLRLKTPTGTISPIHIRYIYLKCLSTILCCWCAHGWTLKLWLQSRWGGRYVGFQMMLWCHDWGCQPPLAASHHSYWYWMHIKCWSTFIAVDGHKGAPLHCYTCGGGGLILGYWGYVKPKWYCSVMIEATANHHCLYPTSILNVNKTFMCCRWAQVCTLTLLHWYSWPKILLFGVSVYMMWWSNKPENTTNSVYDCLFVPGRKLWTRCQ